jgi:HEAT repeat protein
MLRFCLTLTSIAVLPGAVAAQSLERMLASVDSGTIHLSFAARPGVCGHGGQGFSVNDESDEDWEVECDDQPVRVSLRVRDHQVVAIRTFVGGHWVPGSPSQDWGTVRAQEAASFFLKLAEQARDLSGDPVLPATLADSMIIWPDLLRIARSSRLPDERRRHAIFWLGQAAGTAVDGALDSIASDEHGDREVRKQAVFALSQRSSSEAIPALIRVARTSRDPELRKSALFWLGQSEDPRALDLFEEILRQ